MRQEILTKEQHHFLKNKWSSQSIEENFKEFEMSLCKLVFLEVIAQISYSKEVNLKKITQGKVAPKFLSCLLHFLEPKNALSK